MAPSSSRPAAGCYRSMDAALCDDLLQEVFRLLPPAAAPAVSLVSRRWLALLRSATSSLTLRLPASSSSSDGPALAALLSRYPYLSALTVVCAAADADAALLAVAAAPAAARLSALRFLPDSAVSAAALLAACPALSGLTSLHLTAVRPLSFRWLALLPRLRSFALVNSAAATAVDSAASDADCDGDAAGPLPLERLSLCGIRSGDRGLPWLWRRCGGLKWLQLRACDSTGDAPASVAFAACLAGLLALELRACRAVADRVLLLAADHCRALTSLLVYDGGSGEALHRFIHQRSAGLHTLDLRLPLDLHNDHLLAIGTEQIHRAQDATCTTLAALRLQSCVLITGDGLRSLARTPTGAGIQELALVSCDVVEREPGLLTFLCQSMPRLRWLDLSYNDTLNDKVIGAMLPSCRNLVGIRLRGCRGLTGASLVSLLRHCGQSLQILDISLCPGIALGNIELFAQSATRLSSIIIEEDSVSEELRAIAQKKGMMVGSMAAVEPF